jgi:hypothetical protein
MIQRRDLAALLAPNPATHHRHKITATTSPPRWEVK